MSTCTVKGVRGWKCIRGAHPHGQPCAAVPKWWNLRALCRYYLQP